MSFATVEKEEEEKEEINEMTLMSNIITYDLTKYMYCLCLPKVVPIPL